ncbi:MAG: OmpH family outer membrane protein [Chthoniobacterales bacterium]
MKKYLTLTLAALSMAFASTASAELKVGTVDMNKVFQGYYKTKDAETKINDARAAAKKELDDRIEGYKKQIDEINKLNDELKKTELSNDTKEQKAKTRDEKINDAKGMEKDINDFRVTREKQLQEQAVRMRNGIVEEINKLIQDKVTAENFDIVFDRSGASLNSVPFLLYARDTFDFSQTIIDTLNKGQTAPAAASATPTATPEKTPKAKK